MTQAVAEDRRRSLHFCEKAHQALNCRVVASTGKQLPTQDPVIYALIEGSDVSLHYVSDDRIRAERNAPTQAWSSSACAYFTGALMNWR